MQSNAAITHVFICFLFIIKSQIVLFTSVGLIRPVCVCVCVQAFVSVKPPAHVRSWPPSTNNLMNKNKHQHSVEPLRFERPAPISGEHFKQVPMETLLHRFCSFREETHAHTHTHTHKHTHTHTHHFEGFMNLRMWKLPPPAGDTRCSEAATIRPILCNAARAPMASWKRASADLSRDTLIPIC